MNKRHSVIILNTLIKINCDRIAGYRLILPYLKDDDEVRSLFLNVIKQSHCFISDIEQEILCLGGTPSICTSIPGRMYHTWLDIRVACGMVKRNSILGSCEFGEHIAKEEYGRAYSSNELTSFQKRMISKHERELATVRFSIKKLKRSHIEFAA